MKTITDTGYIGRVESAEYIAEDLLRKFKQWAAENPHEGIDQKVKVTITVEEINEDS